MESVPQFNFRNVQACYRLILRYEWLPIDQLGGHITLSIKAAGRQADG